MNKIWPGNLATTFNFFPGGITFMISTKNSKGFSSIQSEVLMKKGPKILINPCLCGHFHFAK